MNTKIYLFPVRLVVVKWLDAASQIGPVTTAEIANKGIERMTAGWVIKDSDYCLTIGSDAAEDGSWRSVTFIPRAYIIGISGMSHPKAAQFKREGDTRCVT